MTTGYTAIIEERADLTFREFALRCARGMDACVMQRDDPVEDPPQVVIERKADNAEFIAEELLTLLRAKTEPHEAAARRVDGRGRRRLNPVLAMVDSAKKTKEDYSRYEAAVDAASGKGCRVVAPRGNELFVDIDDADGLAVFDASIERLKEIEPCFYSVTPSPSARPGRFHIVVTLTRDVRDPFERILLQAILGSDRVREGLSWQRAVRGDPVPTLFFEKSEPAGVCEDVVYDDVRKVG